MENNYVEIYGGKMYGFVYITTNNINGKKYIGQKKYDECGNWKDYLGSGIILTKSIKKYGKENFSKEIIEECETKEQLNEREKYWISYYNAVDSDDFYNIAFGGDGGRTCYGATHYASKKVYQYDLEGNFLREWDNIKRAAEEYNISPSDISRTCRNEAKQTGNFQWSFIKYDNLHKKAKEYSGAKEIYQLDQNFKIIKTYKNISHIDSNIYNREKITYCCHFRAITHNGYYWVYSEYYNEETINKIICLKSKQRKDVLSKKIYQLDSSKNIISVYRNSLDASKECGIKRGTIQAYCKRGVANHGLNTTGYYWTYEKPIEPVMCELKVIDKE